jgi:hypothetical protein
MTVACGGRLPRVLALLLCVAWVAAAPAGAAPPLTWSSASIDGGALTGVSCASVSLCVAVDGQGNVLVSTTPAGGAASWHTASIDGGALTGVSCASVSLCVAVDGAGYVLASVAPAGGAPWRARAIDPSLGLLSVSCGSAGLCVAVDGSGDTFASANPGAEAPTWNSTAIDPLGAPTGIGCAGGLCVAIDRAGATFTSDNPTAAAPVWPRTLIDPGARLTGVACVPEGFCAAVDAGGRVLIAHVPSPTVTTGPAGEVTQISATLTGTVNPYDATLLDCRFEYGSTMAYGQTVPCASLPAAADAAEPASAPLNGLAANATYHYRLVASSAIGETVGLDQTFATQAPPLVQPHPSIGGIPAPGQRLACRSGVSTTTGVTLAYAWLRDQSTIRGASGSTYLVSGADTSHHLQCRVTATNAAGSVTATSGFVTVPAGGLGTISETTVGAPRPGRAGVSVPLTCSRQAAGGCTITLRLTVVETLRGGRVLAVAAARRTVRRTVTVGASTVRLRPGQRFTATVTLNAAGRRLLAQRRRLTARLSVTGTVVGAIRASLQSTTVTLTASGRVSSHRAPSHRPHHRR